MLLNKFRVPAVVTGIALIVTTTATSAIAGQNISLDSDEGSANGTITWTGSKSFNYNITVKSKKGNSVYIQNKGVRDFVLDTVWGRMTENTTDTRGQTFSSGWSYPVKVTGVKLRVCRDVRFGRDKCGGWKEYRRP